MTTIKWYFISVKLVYYRHQYISYIHSSSLQHSYIHSVYISYISIFTCIYRHTDTLSLSSIFCLHSFLCQSSHLHLSYTETHTQYTAIEIKIEYMQIWILFYFWNFICLSFLVCFSSFFWLDLICISLNILHWFADQNQLILISHNTVQ